MRRIIPIILVFCLLTGLAGCSFLKDTTYGNETASTGNTTQNDQDDTTSGSNITVQQLPMVAVAVPVVTKSETAEDGTVLFNSTFQNISLIVPDPEVADKIIIDFLNRTDVHTSNDSILSLAKSIYTDGAESFTPYWAQITYEPMRLDKGVLGMFGSYASYTGAAHAEVLCRSVNYDMVTGKVLSLSDILTDTATSSDICQLVLDSLTAQKEEKGLYEGFETTVKDFFGNSTLSNADWFFSDTGLCFFFSPYEIAPYSCGAIIAEIPYSSLVGIMNDTYFPAERETAFGSVQAEVFDEATLDRFTQFAEVVLEEGSDKILLYTDKSVYDVRVETGTWSSDGSTFTPDHTVLAAYSLTPGDAIMIDSPLNNTLPTLRLSYNTNGETVRFYVTVNRSENTVSLIES